MMEIINLLLIISLPIILTINDIFFIYRSYTLRISPLYILAAILTINTIMTFVMAVGVFSYDPQLIFNLMFISFILVPIIFLLFAFFFESYERNSYFSLRTTLYSIIIGGIYGIMLVYPPLKTDILVIPFTGTFPIISILEPWFAIGISFVALILGIQALIIFRHSLRIMPPRAHKYIWHMLIAMLFYTLGISFDYFFSGVVVTVGIFNLLGQQGLAIFIDPIIIFGFSQIYFAISYGFLSKHPGWLQIPRIHKLLVMKDNGITIFSHTFGYFKQKEKKLPEIDDQLLGGGLDALRKFFAEIAGKKAGDVKEIRFFNFSMLLEVQSKRYITALLVDSATVFAIKALKAFSEDFNKKFGDKLINWDGDIRIFQDAEEIVKLYFEED